MDNGYIWLCFMFLAWLGALITAFVMNFPIGCFLLLISLGFVYLAINN